MSRPFRLADLVVPDGPEVRDPAAYGERVAALGAASATRVMDLIDTFGSDRVVVGTPRADGSVVVQYPTGKMHSDCVLGVLGNDGEWTGEFEYIREPRPWPRA